MKDMITTNDPYFIQSRGNYDIANLIDINKQT